MKRERAPRKTRRARPNGDVHELAQTGFKPRFSKLHADPQNDNEYTRHLVAGPEGLHIQSAAVNHTRYHILNEKRDAAEQLWSSLGREPKALPRVVKELNLAGVGLPTDYGEAEMLRGKETPLVVGGVNVLYYFNDPINRKQVEDSLKRLQREQKRVADKLTEMRGSRTFSTEEPIKTTLAKQQVVIGITQPQRRAIGEQGNNCLGRVIGADPSVPYIAVIALDHWWGLSYGSGRGSGGEFSYKSWHLDEVKAYGNAQPRYSDAKAYPLLKAVIDTYGEEALQCPQSVPEEQQLSVKLDQITYMIREHRSTLGYLEGARVGDTHLVRVSGRGHDDVEEWDNNINLPPKMVAAIQSYIRRHGPRHFGWLYIPILTKRGAWGWDSSLSMYNDPDTQGVLHFKHFPYSPDIQPWHTLICAVAAEEAGEPLLYYIGKDKEGNARYGGLLGPYVESCSYQHMVLDSVREVLDYLGWDGKTIVRDNGRRRARRNPAPATAEVRKLLQEVPELLGTQDYSTGWIDPDGKFESLGGGMTHHHWATNHLYNLRDPEYARGENLLRDRGWLQVANIWQIGSNDRPCARPAWETAAALLKEACKVTGSPPHETNIWWQEHATAEAAIRKVLGRQALDDVYAELPPPPKIKRRAADNGRRRRST